jgi:hypothetical protein
MKQALLESRYPPVITLLFFPPFKTTKNMNLNLAIFRKALYAIGVLIIYSCGCKDCQNRIEDKISSLPYEDQNIVSFQQVGTNLTRTDTVKITYDPPTGNYGCDGEKEGSTVCYGRLTMVIGDFVLIMQQGFRNDDTPSEVNVGFTVNYIFHCDIYHLSDTVEFNYYGAMIQVRHFKADTTLLDSPYFHEGDCNLSNYCSDFYLTSNNRLIQYNLMNNKLEEKWKLINGN